MSYSHHTGVVEPKGWWWALAFPTQMFESPTSLCHAQESNQMIYYCIKNQRENANLAELCVIYCFRRTWSTATARMRSRALYGLSFVPVACAVNREHFHESCTLSSQRWTFLWIGHTMMKLMLYLCFLNLVVTAFNFASKSSEFESSKEKYLQKKHAYESLFSTEVALIKFKRIWRKKFLRRRFFYPSGNGSSFNPNLITNQEKKW